MNRAKFTSVDDLFTARAADEEKIALVGMLKENEKNKDTVLYAPANCEAWIEIKKSEITSTEYLGEAGCVKEGESPHRHPRIRLLLNRKYVSGDPNLSAIAQLSRRLLLSQTELSRRAGGVTPQDAWGACGSHCRDENGPWECPPETRPHYFYPTGCQCEEDPICTG